MPGPSLRTIERELRRLLRERGRPDLAERALDRVAFTNDGSTLYVHVFARPDWPYYRPGKAYALAHADLEGLARCSDVRLLLEDGLAMAHDDIASIVQWFERWEFRQPGARPARAGG